MSGISYAEGALLVTALVWGINPPIMKLGLAYLPPMEYNTLRMLIALCTAAGALALTGKYRAMPWEDWKRLIQISVFGFFGFQLCFTWGIQATTAGNAALILGILPVCVAIINRVCGIEEISRTVAAGIALSIAGIACVVLGSGKALSAAGGHLLGAMLIVCGQFAYGYYTVFGRELMTKYSIYHIATVVVAINSLFLVVATAPSLVSIDWAALPAMGWISAAYSGIFALTAGNFLWIYGVSRIGSSKASLYNNLSPLFAIAAGYVLLEETFGLIQLGGAILIFSGLYLTRQSKPAANSPTNYRAERS